MEAPTQRLTLAQRFCFSIGHVQNDITASMWFTYLLMWFQTVLAWPSNIAGIIMLIGQVADALATPIVGYQADLRFSDKYWFCRYGRRKTWHIIGTVCVLVSFPFIFSPCIGFTADNNYWEQLAYYSVFVVIFQFGWASVQVAHLALIPDLTPSPNERTGLIASRYTFTVISSVLVYCVMWVFLHTNGDDLNGSIGPSDMSSFQYSMLVGLIVGTVCTVLFHIGVKEGSSAPREDGPARGGEAGPTCPRHKTAKEHMCTMILYQVAGVYMASRLFSNLVQVYVPLYLQDEEMGAQSIATVPLVMFLGGFAASLVVKRMNKLLGREVSFIIGCFIGFGGCVWVYFGSGDTYKAYEIYPVAILLGVGSTIQVVISTGLTADLIGTDTDSSAFVYGAMSFADKLSNGAAVALLQAYFDSNYRAVLAIVCGASCLLGMMFLATLRCRCPKVSISDDPAVSGKEKAEGVTNHALDSVG